MRIAAIYDIHGNLPALEAVLDDIISEQVDLIIVGGDVVAGPMPLEVLALLQDVSMQIPTQFIHGNAESELLNYLEGRGMNVLSQQAEVVTRWVAERFPPAYQQFLSSWPMTLQFKIEGRGQVLFCHATPHSDTAVFTRLTSDDKVLSLLGEVGVNWVICGHTHMQFERTVGRIHIANAGSVGMPFGHTGADWLMFDQKISLRHTAYNLTSAADRIRQTKYPQADDFATNNVLQAPSEKLALEMLRQLEISQTQKR